MKFIKVLASAFLIYLFSFCQVMAQGNDSMKVELKNAGLEINSKWGDIAPVISADGEMMMFTSRRPVTEKEIKSGKSTKERIFVSHLTKATNTWSKAVALDATVNAPGRNNSAISLSNDGQKLLLFRDDIKGNGDIYESVLKGTTWSEAVKLPEPVNSDYHESSASYSHDGNTIYFVSDRKGGNGGRDIWSSTRDSKGVWGPAVNIGKTINTSDDEEGVFMHPDGETLYFSSKAHNSSGGYDVNKSILKNGQWSAPTSLGKPVNSIRHDVFFVLKANGREGFYASDAPGGQGEEDIYIVTFTPVEKAKGPRLTLLKGIIFDELSKAPLDALLELTDNTTGEKIATLNSNSASGKYLISLPAGKNYGINVSATGYLFHSVNVFMPDTSDYVEIEKNIGLKKLEVGSRIVLNNIFYDFDKSTLRNESISELDRVYAMLNSNSTMRIELSSHTDNIGTDEYNQKLSQERAQSVVDYLTGKGIDKSRLVAKGYGESTPIAPNETDEGRQLNRRTEFSILSK